MGGATFARSHTFVPGETYTASLANGIETNILNNFNFAGLDDYSEDTTQMRVNTDPYPAGSESLATSAQGEIERLRYLIAQITGETYWYQDPDISLSTLNTAFVQGEYRNLVIANDGTNPNYQVDVTAAEIALTDTNNAIKIFRTVSVTADITASGANGLDTGIEAGTTWYHIWVVGKTDGTVAALLSTSSTAPTMPSGYTFKAYVGAIYNDGSNNFIKLYQLDNKAARAEVAVLTNGTQSSATAISLTSAIPTTAKYVVGNSRYDYVSVAGFAYVYAQYLSTNINVQNLGKANASMDNVLANFTLPNISNEIYYNVSSGDSQLDINVTGWLF